MKLTLNLKTSKDKQFDICSKDNKQVTLRLRNDKEDKKKSDRRRRKSMISLNNPLEFGFRKSRKKKKDESSDDDKEINIHDLIEKSSQRELEKKRNKDGTKTKKKEESEVEELKENFKKKEKDKNKEFSEENNYEEKNSRKKSNIKYIILIIILTLLIFILAFIITYFDIKIKKNQNSDNNVNDANNANDNNTTNTNTNINTNDNSNKCENGYFLPSDGDQCQKCSVQNCAKCIGNKMKDFCIFCLSGFNAIYDNDNEMIISCQNYNIDEQCSSFDINENKCKVCNEGYFLAFYKQNLQKCQKCDIENCEECFGTRLSYVCTTCQKGYYIPQDDESRQSCKACSVKNCKECDGTKLVNYCYECKENYTPIKVNNVITKCEGCESGSNEKCLTCDNSTGQCASCNEGYYLPSDDTNKEKCQKCSVENCKICSGTIAFNTCETCLDNFNLVNGKCI